MDNVDNEMDNNEGGGRQDSAPLDAIGLKHLAPEFAITVWPTRTAMLQQLIGDYSATSFERAVWLFLQPYACSQYFVLPSNIFSVWHKLTLYHCPHTFAPNQPLQHDVICVVSPTHSLLSLPLSLRRCAPLFPFSFLWLCCVSCSCTLLSSKSFFLLCAAAHCCVWLGLYDLFCMFLFVLGYMPY